MAIYKPSNCTPFLTAKDLTEGFDISCELNTSNEIVTGYKIRILDSKNNLVYEGDEYSEIKIPAQSNTNGAATNGVGKGYSNTGLNGSMLILPLIVNLEVKPELSAMRKNIIYHYVDATTNPGTDKFVYLGKNDSGAVAVVDINAENPYLFTNQSVNQPFKWEITLAQGQIIGETFSQVPSNNKYYDMTVSTGKILGSCGERIQSYLSEYIYKDYYLQLYSDANAETQLGQRVRISSYDHSYGYIYPQEGTLDDGTVQNAKIFQVFKDTNDPQYVSATRKVDYISYSNPLTYTPAGVPINADVALDTNTNTLTLIYEGGSGYNSLSTYVVGASGELTSNTTILFVKFGSGDLYLPELVGYSSSKYNGVWQFVNCTVDGTKTTVNWQRPSAFSNYAAYIGRAINVANGTYGARNYSCDAQADIGGKINETALTFYDETPVGLYLAYDGNKEIETKSISGKFDSSGTTYSEVIAISTGDLVNNVVSAKFTDLQSEEKAQIIATPAGGNHIKISCSNLTNRAYNYTITYNYLTSIAPVLKTGYDVDGTVNTQFVYLNPSINVENGTKLFSGDNLSNNCTISKFDNEPNLNNKFSPTYSAVLTANNSTDIIYPKLNDDYEVRSFFKISDENSFYAYDTPTFMIDVKPKNENYDNNVKSVNFETFNANLINVGSLTEEGAKKYAYAILTWYESYNGYWPTCYDKDDKEVSTGAITGSYPTLNSLGVVLYDSSKAAKFTVINNLDYSKIPSNTDFVATNRYINVSATYTQNQNKSWKSFYWTLEDENGYIRATDKTYIGEIATKFLGLESGKGYNLTLYLEDEMGNFYTISKTVYCGANVDTGTKVDFSGVLNCDDYAVDIHVGANGLIDKPTVQNGVTVNYTNNVMQITGSGAKDESLVLYEYIKLGPSQSSIPNIFTTENPVKLVSEHTGLASDFKGGIIEYQIGDETETVGAYLEPLVVDSDVEINGKKLVKVNPNRNNIYFKNNTISNNVSWQDNVNNKADKSVFSTWVPHNTGSAGEYIDSDISPRNEKWVNIKGELNNQNSSDKIIMPFNAISSTVGSNISIWSDRKIEYDADGKINVFVLNVSNNYEYNIWNDENHYWQDTPVDSGEIKKYENGSVQTNLKNQTFKFEFDKAAGGTNYKVTVTQNKDATAAVTKEVEIKNG